MHCRSCRPVTHKRRCCSRSRKVAELDCAPRSAPPKQCPRTVGVLDPWLDAWTTPTVLGVIVVDTSSDSGACSGAVTAQCSPSRRLIVEGHRSPRHEEAARPPTMAATSQAAGPPFVGRAACLPASVPWAPAHPPSADAMRERSTPGALAARVLGCCPACPLSLSASRAHAHFAS